MASLLEALKRPARALRDAVHRRRRQADLQRHAPHASRTDIVSGLRALGISQGDVLFVHSSLKSLGFVEGGAETVIAAMKDSVGPTGTLLFPTYWLPGGTLLATCEMKDYTFDPRRHGTNMGALPEAFLRQPGVQRSIHPTHSCAALGPMAEHLTRDHHRAPSVFGEGSPWDRFAALRQGKVLGLGISMGPVTFYHLLEDRLGESFPLPIWLDRQYDLPCLDHDGLPCTVPVRPFDPALTHRRIDQKQRVDLRDWFAREFELAGIKRNGKVAAAESWIIEGPAFLDHLHVLARRGVTVYALPEDLQAQE